MSPDRDRLSSYQLGAVLTVVIMGHRVITVPRTATSSAGEAGWLTILLAALLALAGAWASHRLVLRHRGQSFVSICRRLIGFWPGTAVSTLLAGLWLVQAGLTAREFGEIVSVTALSRTPYLVTVVATLGASGYLLSRGARVLGRVSELYWVYAALTLVGGAVASLPYARGYHLLPWYGRGPAAVLAGTVTTFGDFSGFDTAPVFMPLLQRPAAGWTAAARGIGLAGGVFLILTLATTAALGVQGISGLAWPTLEIVRMARVPGRFLERLDAIFVSVGVTAIFAAVSVYLFAAVLLLEEVLHLRARGALAVLLPGVAVAVASLPPDLFTLFGWLERTSQWLWFSGLLLPFGLLAVSRLRDAIRRGGQP